MATSITKIDDKEDGFRVEFSVTTQYSRVFDKRPNDVNQMAYAREQVAAIVITPVENPAGVVVIPQPAKEEPPEGVIDLTPIAEDALPEVEIPIE